MKNLLIDLGLFLEEVGSRALDSETVGLAFAFGVVFMMGVIFALELFCR